MHHVLSTTQCFVLFKPHLRPLCKHIKRRSCKTTIPHHLIGTSGGSHVVWIRSWMRASEQYPCTHFVEELSGLGGMHVQQRHSPQFRWPAGCGRHYDMWKTCSSASPSYRKCFAPCERRSKNPALVGTVIRHQRVIYSSDRG